MSRSTVIDVARLVPYKVLHVQEVGLFGTEAAAAKQVLHWRTSATSATPGLAGSGISKRTALICDLLADPTPTHGPVVLEPMAIKTFVVMLRDAGCVQWETRQKGAGILRRRTELSSKMRASFIHQMQGLTVLSYAVVAVIAIVVFPHARTWLQNRFAAINSRAWPVAGSR
jgi:hypothetical protein